MLAVDYLGAERNPLNEAELRVQASARDGSRKFCYRVDGDPLYIWDLGPDIQKPGMALRPAPPRKGN
jgi:hypothetical protein